MTIQIIVRDMKIAPAIEKTIEQKLTSHLKKYKQQQGDDVIVTVKVSERKLFTRVDVDMPYLHYHIHAESETSDGVLTGIDRCIEHLERQIEKYKTRMQRTKFKGKAVKSLAEDTDIYSDNDEQERKIIKSEHFELKPMSIDEAILQMDVLENKFLVFHNTETESISVIYKRDDGNIGLIET